LPLDGDEELLFEALPQTPGNVETELGKYLNRIDLTWDRTASDAVPPKRPTGYVLDRQIVDASAPVTPWIRLQSNTGNSRGTYNDKKDLKPGQTWNYRIFPEDRGTYGVPATIPGRTKAATIPDPVPGLTATADGPTRIKLDWDAPVSNGGATLTGYLVQVHQDDDDDSTFGNDGTSWENAPKGHIKDAATRTYTYDPTGNDDPAGPLESEDARWFRVIALNSVNTNADATPNLGADDMSTARRVRGQTAGSGRPGMPDGLVAEPAKDTNADFAAEKGILLLWNAPDDPAGDTVTGYVIARRVKPAGGAWGAWDEAWYSITGKGDHYMRTYHTDTSEPDLDGGEERMYRVVAKSGAGTGAPTPAITYPHPGTASIEVGAPSNAVAMSDAAGMVTVDWTSGDNALGHLVLLFKSDFSGTPMVGTPSGNSHTFSGVPTGSYIAVVVSYRSVSDYKYEALLSVVTVR
jgi:hypothetical protein